MHMRRSETRPACSAFSDWGGMVVCSHVRTYIRTYVTAPAVCRAQCAWDCMDVKISFSTDADTSLFLSFAHVRVFVSVVRVV